MSRKYLISFLLAALVAAAVIVGVVATRAQGSTSLPSISPAALLAKVATAAKSPVPVSGSVTWTNGLIPGSSAASLLGGQTAAPSSVAGLAMGGSGRVWVQPGTGARLEVQGSGSDFVVVGSGSGVWTYSSATNTAAHYMPQAAAMAPSTSPSPSTSTVNPLAAITKGLQHFASTGTVAVTGQQTVAGQQSYMLTITPAPGTTTTFGSVQVAVDGSTFVPLQVQVYANGDTTPALSAGFTSVSYARNSASLFRFTPPAGATVQHKTLPAMANPASAMTAPTSAKHAPLTLAQAQAQAKSYGLTLAVPANTTSLPFEGATVTAGSGGHGATAVLHYGRGFGSVVLVESTGATGPSGALAQQLAKVPKGLLTTTTIGGAQAHELSTSLVDAIVWQHGPVTLLTAGMVPSHTLQQFAAGIR